MLEDGTAWVRDYVPGTEPPPDAVEELLVACKAIDGSLA